MKSLPGDTNQVSIIVVVQDRFSLVPNGTFGKDLWRAELRERNFLGRGHQMTFTATGGNQFNPRNALYFSYAMPILGKQLWQLAGDFCFQESSGFRNIQVSRPLLSPLFKWGGGAGYGIRYGLADPLSLPGSAPQIINLERTEAWLARAVALKFRHKRVSRQMIFSGSYNLARQHLNGSGPQIQGIEEKSESFLGSVGFTLLHRYRKKFMFSWEQVNDFTEGASIYLTNGWIDQGDKAHLYSGISVMLARQFNAGYFFLGGNVGIRSGRAVLPEQAAEARALYVAPLINLGKYRLRTALNGRMLQGGSNPFSTPLVTDGRSENAWQYNGRILQSLATSSVDLRLAIYTPWKPFGLNIAPFLYAGATQLRSWPQLGISSGWLPATGFGIILRHVKLAFNVVRLSFIYFPYSLSSDQPLYQLLPAGLFDLQTPDFEVPQPRTVTGI